MIRDETCPLCGSKTEPILQLEFNVKMKLPTRVGIRHCAADDFLFVGDCAQRDYDEYYQSLSNDSYHAELSTDGLHSPISQLQLSQLKRALGNFFESERKVLDFGCGEGSLLVELASSFPTSSFYGFDPSPAAQVGAKKAEVLGLSNLEIHNSVDTANSGKYDLVILSHVAEHLLEFDLLNAVSDLLAPGGVLYIEVPNSLQYETYGRREYLYYFDRLHVNHFTPRSLNRLVAKYKFGYVGHFEFAFPYRDGGEYPALGMLFRKGKEVVDIESPNIVEMVERYLAAEVRRAKAIADQFSEFEGVLVWGAGDNFYRSMSENGPLSELRRLVLLDSRPKKITVRNLQFTTQDPQAAIRQYPWPVIITVSENKIMLREQVHEIDPGRLVFFV